MKPPKADQAPNKNSIEFNYKTKRARITMTSPSPDQLDAPGVWEYRDDVDKSPKTVAGFHCPASFVAEGLGPAIRFSIALNSAKKVYIDRIEVEFDGQSPASYAIPLTRLTEHAISAAGRVGLQFPKGYAGFSDKLGATVETGPDEWFVVVLESRALREPERRKIASQEFVSVPRKPKVNEVSDQILRKVAKAHKNAKWGEQREAVQAAIGGASESTVRDYIRKARERGFLDDVSDQDLRKTRRKK